MALPRLNDVPEYELTVPSTGQSVAFRPFLVKEQKVLMIAFESKDVKEILRSVMNCIDACVKNIDVGKLATFDVDYIFTQIRSKSVGESSTVNLTCGQCGESNEVAIDLNDIKINLNDQSKIIKLNEKYTLVMKYPNYASVVANSDNTQDDTLTEVIFETIIMCMDELRTEDDIIKLADEPREELETFLDGLNSVKLENIMNFVNNLPRLEHTVEYKCESCEHENKITLQGIQDFFS